MTAKPTKLVHTQYYIVPWFPCPDPAIGFTRASYMLKKNCTVVGALNRGCLSRVENEATLLIDGHSTAADPEHIEADFNGQTARRNVVAVGQLIADFWRLPKGHVKIRMLSCYGNGFARNLAMNLQSQHGYYRIVVAGYKHNVSSGAGRSPVTGRGTNALVINGGLKFKGDDDLPESERISWFDGNGNQVPKPDFPRTINVEFDKYD